MIEELERLTARTGQRIKPTLKSFLAWLRSQRIEAGPGIRILRTAAGTCVSANVPSPTFLGDFTVSLTEEGRFYVARGFVNGIEPKINGIPITGDKDNERPSLKLPKEFDKSGRAWALVQVTLNKQTERIDEKARDSVVVVADKTTSSPALIRRGAKRTADAPLVGRHPIAMFLKGEDGRILTYQLSFFSLRHAFAKKRHFFVPA